ncbi:MULTISPECIES: hypothetical protein [Cupriavidus]|uniref:hypothetical protein n=1 Tax=Cupriavidus TaxID=106589 RepID=UPI000A8056FB|nr:MULTISPECIES: hypothetical protein [Cupriavidus]
MFVSERRQAAPIAYPTIRTYWEFVDAMTPEAGAKPYGRAVPRFRDSDMRKFLNKNLPGDWKGGKF